MTKSWNKLEWYLIAVLFILSLGLRLWRFPLTADLQDLGTELLTAYHAAFYGEYPLLGVHASSIEFSHPPWYLYILAGLVHLIASVQNLIAVSLVVHAASVIPLYITVLRLFGRASAVIASLFYATTPTIIELSYTLQSQNIIVPVTMVSFLFWLTYHKHKGLLPILTVFVLILTTTVNYAAWIIVLPLILYDIYRLPHKRFIQLCLWVTAFLLLYTPLFIYYGFFETLLHFISVPGRLIFQAVLLAGESHYRNIFLPILIVGAGGLLGKLYKNKYAAWKYGVIVLVAAISVVNLFHLASSPKKGDVTNILSCVDSVAAEIQKSNINTIRLIILDQDRKDKWLHLTSLVERKLNRQLVMLDKTRGYFLWPTPVEHHYVLHMDSCKLYPLEHPTP